MKFPLPTRLSIYAKSKAEAREIGNAIYEFLRDKLRLPINREKSGIRRPVNFELLGHGFATVYKKGVHGTCMDEDLLIVSNGIDFLLYPTDEKRRFLT